MTQLSEPTAARVSALYDQAAELLPEDFGLFPNLHFGYWEGPEGDAEGEATLQDAAARLTGLVAARLGAGPGTRMLDVGCGVGGPALQIARATGCHVVGITLSAGQVGLARALADRDGASDRLAFLRADAAELPFEDDSFDAAWALESLPHMPDRARALSEMARVVRPGGRIVATDMYARAPFPEPERQLMERISRAWVLSPLPAFGDYPRLLEGAGLRPSELSDITDRTLPPSLLALADLIRAREPAIAAAADDAGAGPGELTRLAAVRQLGYLLLTAEVPA